MMWIVDHTEDYRSNDLKTKTFMDEGNKGSSEHCIIEFVASKSNSKDFKIVRINKYAYGKLTPYELTLTLGRISLQPLDTKEATNYDPT